MDLFLSNKIYKLIIVGRAHMSAVEAIWMICGFSVKQAE